MSGDFKSDFRAKLDSWLNLFVDKLSWICLLSDYEYCLQRERYIENENISLSENKWIIDVASS